MLRTRLFSCFTLLSSLAVLSGCGSNMIPTQASDSIAATGSMSGTIHGGRQPVIGATVTLWAAGNTGYGSAATQLAQTTSDSGGNFNFGPGSGHTYTCPSSISTTATQLIYLVASGGQPTTNVTNDQAAFMVALGDCITIQSTNPTLDVNEVTTVASMTALQQFFSPSASGLGSFGTSSTNTLGLLNAMGTVKNLVNLASGSAYASTTVSGTVSGYTSSPVITITPEQSKINTMADILAACINTNGTASTPCSTLFNNVNTTPAKDTLQAAYYMASNPISATSTSTVATCGSGASAVTTTSTICNLYGLAVAQGPFSPTLPKAPTDWTIGLTYGSSSTQTVAGSPVYLLNNPGFLAIDSLGNVWIANAVTGSATSVGNSVTELSPIGVPEAQIFTAVGQLAAPFNLIIDPNNNIYVGSYGDSGLGHTITEYTGTNLTRSFQTVLTGPSGLASDGSGNIFIANYGGAAGSGDLEVLSAGSPNGTMASQIATGVSVGTNSSLAIDSYSNLWLSNNQSTLTTQYICNANPCNPTTTVAGGQTAPRSIAIDHSNNIWIGNASSTAGTMSELASTNTSTINGASNSPFSGGGLLNPIRSTFGGLGNQWITNFTTTGGSLTELSTSGAAVSPSVGFSHSFSGAEGVAIDGSGNVWVGNYTAAAPSGFITEIVGAAGPVITPFSTNLPAVAGGANTISIRP